MPDPTAQSDCESGCIRHQTCAAQNLPGLVVEAEQAARRAHDAALAGGAPVWMCWSLGRAQSILMHYVVKGARGGWSAELCSACGERAVVEDVYCRECLNEYIDPDEYDPFSSLGGS